VLFTSLSLTVWYRDWHGNGYGNVNVFGLGGIDLLHCSCRASTETCYCQYILLLWACQTRCSCTFNIHGL